MKIKVYDKAKTQPEPELYIKLAQGSDRVDIQVVDANGKVQATILGICSDGTVRSYGLVSRHLNLDLGLEGRVIVRPADG